MTYTSGPVFAVMMVKDEADIIRQNLEHLRSEGVEHVVVADNLSTDGTTDILREFEIEGFVTYEFDDVVGYYQANKTLRLVHIASTMGADWVIPVDADEFWYSPHGRLVDVLRTSRFEVLWAEGFYQVPHADDDPSEADPVQRIRHRRAGRDCPQSKVCFRFVPNVRLVPGNHDVTHPGTRAVGQVAFREFQYRSFEHFVRKVRNGKAAYDAAPEMAMDCGVHWRRLGALSDEQLAEEWASYLTTPTEYDPAPVFNIEAAA